MKAGSKTVYSALCIAEHIAEDWARSVIYFLNNWNNRITYKSQRHMEVEIANPLPSTM